MKIGNLEVYGVIYKITNKINGKVYIGQTADDKGFDGRYSRKGKDIERVYNKLLGLNNNGWKYNKHLFDALNKYGLDNFEVNKVLDFAFSSEELNIKERIWINYYNSYKDGYNNNEGGDGNRGYKGFEGSNNPFSKKVVQLSKSGEFIRTWDYMGEAEEFLGILRSKIGSVCNKKRKTAGGYVWVYYEEYVSKDYIFAPPVENRTNKKRVVQLTPKGDFVCSYESMAEASKENNIRVSGISRCCSGTRKTYMDYIWMYEDEYDEKVDYSVSYLSNDGKAKVVLVFDKNMNFIEECLSINEASKKYGYSLSSLKNHLHKRGNKITGHIFVFKEEYSNN